MRKIILLFALMIASTACNLTASTATDLATYTPAPEVTAAPTGALPTLTSIVPQSRDVQTSGTKQPPQATLVPVTSVPSLGTTCQVYTAFSGSDPENKLSLRDDAKVDAMQIALVATGSRVLLVPNSGEKEGSGYHWLNVIYEVSPTQRYRGWIARDSYQVNGVRKPDIATLSPTNTSLPC